MPDIQIALSAIYQRQFKKLKTEDLKRQALEVQRDILRLLQLQARGTSGEGKDAEARHISTKRRITVIQRFTSETPTRFEATFAPDGRIAWSYDGTTLTFILIGTHRVLDMN